MFSSISTPSSSSGSNEGNSETSIFESNSFDCGGLCPKLTRMQRIYGFVGCFCAGWALALIGWFVLLGGTFSGNTDVRTFAVLYCMGNLIAISSSLFLMGPAHQCKRMFDKTRRITTCVYLGLIFLVMIIALAWQASGAVAVLIILMGCQMVAGVWYAASYIPFGRKIILSTLKGLCGVK